LQLWELERPAVGDEEALIRVEACGICGSDIGMYRAESSGYGGEFPIIRGHEPVGRIEEIGARFAERHNLKPGDRVAVDPFLHCGTCRYCLEGRGELCTGGAQGAHNTYAMIPMSVAPGLWGGFSTHLVATSQTILYPIPDHVPSTLAALFNVLGAGIKWGVDAAGTRIGSSVAVLGCGQRGLACALAARTAGAETVIVTGLAKDAFKLALARDFGITASVDVEAEDLKDVVFNLAPDGVDIVIDTTPFATQAVVDAVSIVRPGGKIVVGGMKGRLVEDFPIDQITRKEVALQGVLGTGSDHYRRAIALIASTSIPLHRLQTHLLSLEQVEYGIQLLAGEVPGENPLNVVIETQ
jgi:threonine dehydrogenase-like Zn-dependent dehydrogenase